MVREYLIAYPIGTVFGFLAEVCPEAVCVCVKKERPQNIQVVYRGERATENILQFDCSWIGNPSNRQLECLRNEEPLDCRTFPSAAVAC